MRFPQTRLRPVATVVLGVALLLVSPLLIGDECDDEAATGFSPDEIRRILTMSPLDSSKALDPTNRYGGDRAVIDFGKSLFFDKRLSRSGDVSCATCHQPGRGWADGVPLSRPKAAFPRHTPTLWNVGYNRWFNWDGRADSLWAQALGPIESDSEMGNDRVSVVRLFMDDEDLREAYTRTLGDLPKALDAANLPASAKPLPHNKRDPRHKAWNGLSEPQRAAVNTVFTRIGKAIAAFEATIVSRHSPFDDFVLGLRTGEKGNLDALSPCAKRGLKLFIGKAGCHLCHSGPSFSDLEFHNVFLAARDGASSADKGRYTGIVAVRGSEFNTQGPYNDAEPGKYVDWLAYLRRTVENRGQFKTPTLRNVDTTAPYAHTGQFASLPEMVGHCGNMYEAIPAGSHSDAVQSPLNLSAEDLWDLVSFLKSLSDESFLTTL